MIKGGRDIFPLLYKEPITICMCQSLEFTRSKVENKENQTQDLGVLEDGIIGKLAHSIVTSDQRSSPCQKSYHGKYILHSII
jgi:hypothetical protein